MRTLRWGPADIDDVLDDHEDWLALAKGERVEFAAKTYRDLLLLTNRRIIQTDTQGFFRRKTEYHSIKYAAIARWSVETRGGGWFDGADFKLWGSSMEKPLLDVELQKDASGRAVAEILARYVL